MYQQDWLDELRWGAILIGTLLALSLQVIVTFTIFRPFGFSLGWSAVVIVELCIACGAFVAGWRARQAAFVNGLITAVASAVISMLATAMSTPGALNLPSIAFLFGTFAVMGALGGFAGGYVQSRREATEVR